MNVMDIVLSALRCPFVHISVCSTRCIDEMDEVLKSKVLWLSRPNQKLNVGIINRFCVHFTLYSGKFYMCSCHPFLGNMEWDISSLIVNK